MTAVRDLLAHVLVVTLAGATTSGSRRPVTAVIRIALLHIGRGGVLIRVRGPADRLRESPYNAGGVGGALALQGPAVGELLSHQGSPWLG